MSHHSWGVEVAVKEFENVHTHGHGKACFCRRTGGA
jgi:hypothetical protein